MSTAEAAVTVRLIAEAGISDKEMSPFNTAVVAAALLGLAWCAEERVPYATTESGRVFGSIRTAENNVEYASFRGIPYAKQPLGELRFKELQPAEPWDLYNATTEGPVCPQIDPYFGSMMQPQGQSEACIHANIHVPIDVLPAEDSDETTTGVPVIVFIHGGGFLSGSGDSDMYGPEYLVSRGAIVVTFNYRLNVFGFLSLNSTSIPGNQGLRDMITLLNWVQNNIKSFGGNPKEVTVAGQSAGAIAAHLLSMSPLAEGLFNRALLMSGTGLEAYYTTSPVYAETMANLMLTNLGITSTNPEEIHTQLCAVPVDTMMTAYKEVQKNTNGMVTFCPMEESQIEGITPVIDKNPTYMAKAGYGSKITIVIGFNTAECQTVQPRMEALNIVEAVEESPLALLPMKLTYATPEEALSDDRLLEIANTLEKKYFDGTVTLNKYLDYCSDAFFVYPALRLAQLRAAVGGETFIYQYSYEAESSVIQKALGLDHAGTGDLEDTSTVFRVNSQLGDHQSFPPTTADDYIKEFATGMLINFMNTGSPTEDSTTWPVVNNSTLMYQDIRSPQVYSHVELTEAQKEMFKVFSSIPYV